MPAVSGVKRMPTAHVFPSAKVVPHVLEATAKSPCATPATMSWRILSAPVAWFRIVTVFTGPSIPSSLGGDLNDAGLTPNWGAASSTATSPVEKPARTRSGAPSLFKSAIASPAAAPWPGIVMGLANCPLPFPSRIETVLSPLFAVAMSSLPSWFMSATAIPAGA